MSQSYKLLEAKLSEHYYLGSIGALLDWDSSTMMPNGASSLRSEQSALVSGLLHKTFVTPHIKYLIEESKSENLNDWQSKNLQIIEHLYLHQSALSEDFSIAFSKATSKCEISWRECKINNDFKTLLPLLEEVVNLVREQAKVKSEILKCSPYEALLDFYDPGRKVAQLEEIFTDLEEFLPSFITQVMDKQRNISIPRINGNFSIEKQKELALDLMEKIGFDFSRGRLDTSSHPFCGGVYGDTRITSRYDQSNFVSGIMGILHETGHALYEQNKPSQWYTQPVGSDLGMSFHEGQSLFIEMQLAQRKEFCEWIVPQLKAKFSEEFNLSAEEYYYCLNRVSPSLIRVDADEVTYHAHIILRYRLEQKLLNGSLEVKDIPDAWNEQLFDLLGIKADSDKNGCLQDIHWPLGSFGYFPTYSLGTMIASQSFMACSADLDPISSLIKVGNFLPIKNWLIEKFYKWGRYYLTSDEMLEKVTGKKLDISSYKSYLRAKYLAL